MEGRAVGGFLRVIREFLASEKLEDLSERSPEPGRESFFAWLLKAEHLPQDSVDGLKARTSFFSRLFEREELAEDPVPSRRRP